MQDKITVELPHIECTTCGANIGNIDMREEFNKLVEEGMSKDEAFEKIGLNNTCCRAKFWNVPVIATCRTRQIAPEIHGITTTRRNNSTSLPGSLFSINSQFTSNAGKQVVISNLPSEKIIALQKVAQKK